MDKLTHTWKEAREAIGQPLQTAEQLLNSARKKKASVLYFHYGNIVVLSITLVLISLFFYTYPFRYMLSKIGMVLMLAGLAIRIIIETHSSLKAKVIQFDNDAIRTTEDALTFYKYRKKIHGPFTITTVGFYVIGFYLLSPEFSVYINLKWMLLIHLSFIAGAFFISWQVWKGIKKEMTHLNGLIGLRKEIQSLLQQES